VTALRTGLQQIRRYPSALVGLAIIIGLIALAIAAVFLIPYDEAIRLWRGGEDIWQESPRYARPAWVNLFSAKKLPETIVLSTLRPSQTVKKTRVDKTITISLAFEYPYDDFPSEITLFFQAQYRELLPYARVSWRTPDGREISLGERKLTASDRYSISQDTRLERRLGNQPPEVGLFASPTAPQAPSRGAMNCRSSGRSLKRTLI
jgi:peptide/nickel transport system permease protein